METSYVYTYAGAGALFLGSLTGIAPGNISQHHRGWHRRRYLGRLSRPVLLATRRGKP